MCSRIGVKGLGCDRRAGGARYGVVAWRGRLRSAEVGVERLSALREERLDEVVRAPAALIDTSDDPWFVLGGRDEIRAILAARLAADDEEVQRRARAATNRLIARLFPQRSLAGKSAPVQTTRDVDLQALCLKPSDGLEPSTPSLP
jgi:hypothetical protein